MTNSEFEAKYVNRIVEEIESKARYKVLKKAEGLYILGPENSEDDDMFIRLGLQTDFKDLETNFKIVS